MLKSEEQMELKVLNKHGDSIRGLARSTGRSRNTVRRYLRGGDEVSKRKPGPKRAEKLDPFKAYIVDRMKAALPDQIPATVLFREIKLRGYEGGETRVKLFVRGLTPLPAVEALVRFETQPGRQMQADWATVGRGADKLSLFIATLGWSRSAYVEFCDDERVETLIGCHESAFLTFAGVPMEVLYDNMKTVVIERNTYGLGAHRFHAGFLDYARHAGFLPRLCHPYRAQTKGKVERFIGYLKRSFWVPFVASMRQAGLKPDKHMRPMLPWRDGFARWRTRGCTRPPTRCPLCVSSSSKRHCRRCRRRMAANRRVVSQRRHANQSLVTSMRWRFMKS